MRDSDFVKLTLDVRALAKRLDAGSATCTSRYRELAHENMALSDRLEMVEARLNADPWRNNQTAPPLAGAEGRPVYPGRDANGDPHDVLCDCAECCTFHGNKAHPPREAAKDSPASLIPPGYRMADGWKRHSTAKFGCTYRDGCGELSCKRMASLDALCKASCDVHAVEMGALVPVEPAPLLTRDDVDQMRTPPQPEAPAGRPSFNHPTLPAEPPSDDGLLDFVNRQRGANGYAPLEKLPAPNAPAKQESPRRASQLSTSACAAKLVGGGWCGDNDRRCVDCLPPSDAGQARVRCPHVPEDEQPCDGCMFKNQPKIPPAPSEPAKAPLIMDRISDLEARLAEAEKARDELKRDFDEMNLQRHEALDGVIRAELAERARVNGWWRRWAYTGGYMSAKRRDECIASGAPVPGGAT